MSVKYVKIYYGPHESFYTLSHKPQKLRGLRNQLLKLGFRVDLVPVKYVDYCMIEMCGHEIFRCNIQNLLFNIPTEKDPVCKRALSAVLDSFEKLTRARLYMYLWSLIEDQIFIRPKLAPQNVWPFEVDSNFDTCLHCTNCSGIIKK